MTNYFINGMYTFNYQSLNMISDAFAASQTSLNGSIHILGFP